MNVAPTRGGEGVIAVGEIRYIPERSCLRCERATLSLHPDAFDTYCNLQHIFLSNSKY